MTGNKQRRSRRAAAARERSPATVPLERRKAPKPAKSSSEEGTGAAAAGSGVEPVLLAVDEVAVWLRALHAEAVLEAARVARMRAVSVVPGQELRVGEGVLAGLSGVLAAGRHVDFRGQGLFVAERYGYLGVQAGRVSVLSPLWLSPDRMCVQWLLLDAESRPVMLDMVLQCLVDIDVVYGIRASVIAAQVARVVAGGHAPGAVVVAAGEPAVDGRDASLELLVHPETEDDAAIQGNAGAVEAGTVVARKLLSTSGRVGRDVCGVVLACRDGKPGDLPTAGANIAVEREDSVETLTATAAGLLVLADSTLSVVPVLHVASVGFEMGNLDFQGRVEVAGDIRRGFQVRAEDSVIVGGSVQAAAVVQAGRDVLVRGGIVGRRTRITAARHVSARRLDGCTVEAGADIRVHGSVRGAVLVAEGIIQITRCADGSGGSMVGGQAWGRHGVSVDVAGSRTGVPTLLAGGLAPAQAARLDKLNEELITTYHQVIRYLERFGVSRVDLSQIRNLIAAATGPRRKLLRISAQRMGELIRKYHDLNAARRQLHDEMKGFASSSYLEIREQAHPGVEMRIAEHFSPVRAKSLRGAVVFRVGEGGLVSTRGQVPYPAAENGTADPQPGAGRARRSGRSERG